MSDKISNKSVRHLVKYAEALGFVWNGKLTGGGHIILRHPGGGRVTLAATPSGKSLILSQKDIEREARK